VAVGEAAEEHVLCHLPEGRDMDVAFCPRVFHADTFNERRSIDLNRR
jgi:hypothetical protein